MSDDKREDDASDKAPRPVVEDKGPSSDKQDAPNYADRDDGGKTIPLDKINSANDE